MTDQSDKKESEFQSSVTKLEDAVQELVTTAKAQLSGRATAFVEETTARLRSELSLQGNATDGLDELDELRGLDDQDELGGLGEAEDVNHRMQGRRRGRHSRKRSRRASRHQARGHRRVARSRQLYRDTKNQKIGGVCAGVANYYGVETWVARCIAITGMIFMPSVTFPAYWIAYFVLNKEPTDEQPKPLSKRKQRKQDKKSKQTMPPNKYISPAPELGPGLSPRRGLRNTQADFDELELRLRRMEGHVTSGQYELQKELHKIDADPGVQTS